MADYWNTVATPFFFIVLGFCLFVLFQLSDIKLVSAEVVDLMAGNLRPPRLTQPGARAPVVGNVGRNVGSAAPPPPPPQQPHLSAMEAPSFLNRSKTPPPGRTGEAAAFDVPRPPPRAPLRLAARYAVPPPPPPKQGALLAHAAPNNERTAANVFDKPAPK